MKISVKPAYEKLIREKVRTGRYRSTDEVLEDALTLLDERDQTEDSEFRRLKRLIDAGLASSARGESKPVDLNEMKAAARAQKARRARK